MTVASREVDASSDNGKSPLNNERDEPKHSEKSETPRDDDHSRAETPHDFESDFEDNITVTVPKPHSHTSTTNNYHDYRERQSGMNGRYTRPNINDMESASNQTQSHQVS